MKMKMKSIFMLAIGLAMAWIYVACSKDENLTPSIKFIRITDLNSSDSLLSAAYQASTIAIIGDNLANAREVWFNDLKASLTPTYITNTSIITTVPSDVPKVVTNTMTVVFGDGYRLEYPFSIVVSKPEVRSMGCEFVSVGNTATLRGKYFYEPLTVKFTGGATGVIKSVKDDLIEVTVPSGALSGPVTVTTNFGETISDFWFRDTRNIFVSSDPFTGWWNPSYVVTNPSEGDPASINGNYIRLNKIVGAWAWTEVVGGPASAMGAISKNIPDDAIMNPEDYNFKFEINTKKPYTSNLIKFNIGINSENNDAYKWEPPYDTKGEWQTVVIPFEEIAAKQPLAETPNPNGYWARILMHGPGELDADISFDNLRIVPKK